MVIWFRLGIQFYSRGVLASTLEYIFRVSFYTQLREKFEDSTGHQNVNRLIDLIDFLCFNATFSNISWRPVLVVEEAGVPGENHRPWASNW